MDRIVKSREEEFCSRGKNIKVKRRNLSIRFPGEQLRESTKVVLPQCKRILREAESSSFRGISSRACLYKVERNDQADGPFRYSTVNLTQPPLQVLPECFNRMQELIPLM